MRRLLQILAVLALLVVLALGGAILYLDRIAKEVVERSGRYALGVDVSVDGVSIGLLSGALRVRGLEIANPPGFEGPHFWSLRKASLDVEPASLRRERVRVSRFAIEGVALRLERQGRRTNAGVLLENLRRFESGEPADPQAPPEPAAEGTRFVVREMVIRDVAVHADLLGGLAKGTPDTLRLTEVRVRDVGSETSGGVVAARLFDLAVKAVLRAVIEERNPLAGALRGELGPSLARLDSLRTDVVGEVEGRAREAAGETAGEAAGRAAEEAGRRLRGLLGGEEEGSGEP